MVLAEPVIDSLPEGGDVEGDKVMLTVADGGLPEGVSEELSVRLSDPEKLPEKLPLVEAESVATALVEMVAEIETLTEMDGLHVSEPEGDTVPLLVPENVSDALIDAQLEELAATLGLMETEAAMEGVGAEELPKLKDGVGLAPTLGVGALLAVNEGGRLAEAESDALWQLLGEAVEVSAVVPVSEEVPVSVVVQVSVKVPPAESVGLVDRAALDVKEEAGDRVALGLRVEVAATVAEGLPPMLRLRVGVIATVPEGLPPLGTCHAGVEGGARRGRHRAAGGHRRRAAWSGGGGRGAGRRRATGGARRDAGGWARGRRRGGAASAD